MKSPKSRKKLNSKTKSYKYKVLFSKPIDLNLNEQNS